MTRLAKNLELAKTLMDRKTYKEDSDECKHHYPFALLICCFALEDCDRCVQLQSVQKLATGIGRVVKV